MIGWIEVVLRPIRSLESETTISTLLPPRPSATPPVPGGELVLLLLQFIGSPRCSKPWFDSAGIDYGIDMTIRDYRWDATAEGWAVAATREMPESLRLKLSDMVGGPFLKCPGRRSSDLFHR